MKTVEEAALCGVWSLFSHKLVGIAMKQCKADNPFELFFFFPKSVTLFFLEWPRSNMRAYIWLFPLPTSLNSGKALENVRELLELTKYNYAELKLTVIADLVSFNKKRDREVSGIKRKDMILQRSLVSERAKAADNKLVKLTKLEKIDLHTPPTSSEGRKSCSSGSTGHTQTYCYHDQ